MGNIHVLDISIANLIAAGEVVDRPASAIKEMMENSIDAGATEITVEVRNGGSSFMRVTDNGCGMDADDAKSCIRRHATSKIKEQRDLDSIATLGFRGEALAAIASVSDFRILTRRHGDEMGTLLRCQAGQIVEFCPTGCPEGTTIIAEALFANIPARRKFLKKDVSETAAVIATVEKIALSHPQIAVRLITDGTLRFSTAGDGKLANAIYAVLGRDFAKKLTPVKDMTDGIGVMGYIGRPDNVRGNRNYQNFFINGRYVKSATATAALEQAFVSYCPSDKFPCCVLNLEMHPSLVDVNVHPAKLEVKFSNEKAVFHAVYCAVRNALEQNISRPEPSAPALRATGDDLKSLGDLITYKAESAEAALQISLDRDKLTVPYKQVSAFDASAAVPVQNRTVTVEYTESEPPLPSRTVPQTPLPFSAPEQFASLQTQTPEKTDSTADSENEEKPFRRLSPPFSAEPVTVYADDYDENGDVLPDPIAVGKAQGYEHNSAYEIPEKYDPVLALTRLALSESPDGQALSEPFSSDDEPTFNDPMREQLLSLSSFDAGVTAQPAAQAPASDATAETVPLPNHKIGGILFQCYVVVEFDDRVILIDKHAAHERILFESLKANIDKVDPVFQILLIPISVTLTPDEQAAALAFARELQAIGFDFASDSAANSFELTQIPAELDRNTASDVFTALVGHLAAGTGTASLSRRALCEKALFQASCKAAVKAGKEDDEGHIRYIVEQTLTHPAIRFCPHGRPVALELTKSQVEHLFHRP